MTDKLRKKTKKAFFKRKYIFYFAVGLLIFSIASAVIYFQNPRSIAMSPGSPCPTATSSAGSSSQLIASIAYKGNVWEAGKWVQKTYDVANFYVPGGEYIPPATYVFSGNGNQVSLCQNGYIIKEGTSFEYTLSNYQNYDLVVSGKSADGSIAAAKFYFMVETGKRYPNNRYLTYETYGYGPTGSTKIISSNMNFRCSSGTDFSLFYQVHNGKCIYPQMLTNFHHETTILVERQAEKSLFSLFGASGDFGRTEVCGLAADTYNKDELNKQIKKYCLGYIFNGIDASSITSNLGCFELTGIFYNNYFCNRQALDSKSSPLTMQKVLMSDNPDDMILINQYCKSNMLVNPLSPISGDYFEDLQDNGYKLC